VIDSLGVFWFFWLGGMILPTANPTSVKMIVLLGLWVSHTHASPAHRQGCGRAQGNERNVPRVHSSGLLRNSHIADVDACPLLISEEQEPGKAVDCNLWWDVLVPAMS
jgi:hypothetical protein